MTTVDAARTEPARHAQRPGRPRILLAPVTITPTKPLNPSHLKGLLWADVVYRATRRLSDVTFRSSHTVFHPCEQTVGFWEYLDRVLGDVDYSGMSEDAIGELYVRYRNDENRAPFAACVPYLDAIERHGWVHPASARLLGLRVDQYRELGLHDPGLTAHQPPAIGLDEVIDRLHALDLCLDLRANGGPVYLDATRDGIPLRQIVGPAGRPNYLACALRDLLPLAADHDEVVLLHDRDLTTDYQLLQRVLSRLGPSVRRVSLGRVPIDGRVMSARHGGWRQHTVRALLAEFGARHTAAALRLGMRLYFVGVLGPGAHDSFRPDLLERHLTRAAKLLASATHASAESLFAWLASHRDTGDRPHVDAYRLTAGLLGRRASTPSRALLAEVFT